jgi:predicted dehydrogenase
VADPEVEVVAITSPNRFHREMALAALSAGKHVHCEKPLAPSVAEALEMTEAAEAAGVVTQAGFNYVKNPVLKLAREMVEAGELGEITGFRGIHAEDYLHDPEAPWSWRLDPMGGGGVIADLGSHIVGLARFLVGPIAELHADLETVVATRPVAPGAAERRPVEVDDVARLQLRFARGCGGSIEASWVATGRKMQLGFELTGSKGSLVFTQERLNELLWYRAGGDPRHAGFTRIEAGPQHAPYGLFCVAPGHQLGFNDLKTIEVAEFLAAIAGGPRLGPDFREALEIQKVIETAIRSSRERRWLPIG